MSLERESNPLRSRGGGVNLIGRNKTDFVTIEIGRTYKLKERLTIGTRIKGEVGSVIKFVKYISACGGTRIVVEPISGKFALIVHSSFFSNSTRILNGNSDKYYDINELKELIGLEDFGEEILFDFYRSNKIKAILLNRNSL